jgi:fatty aldehyde-generating acyl-ACP reductase
VNQFAFLTHPLSMKDVVRYAPKAAGKREPIVLKILEWMPPYDAATIKGVRSTRGVDIDGNFVMVPLMPGQFLSLDRSAVIERVKNAALLGQKMGAQVIGLGGYNSVVGRAGKDVADALDVAVTSGNSYTVATALKGALKAAEVLDVDLTRSTVAVIGATGSIGSVCSRYLANHVPRLVLSARSKSRLKVLAETIQRESSTALKIEMDLSRALSEADIVITATSSGGSIIQAEHLKTGAIVCDVAVPHDVCREVAQLRPDVLVIEGGLVEIPGEVEFGLDFGYPPGLALACMAETMVLTLEKRFENFSIGRGLDYDRVQEIDALADRNGFRLAGFRAFDEPVTEEKIEQVRTYILETRKRLRVIS